MGPPIPRTPVIIQSDAMSNLQAYRIRHRRLDRIEQYLTQKADALAHRVQRGIMGQRTREIASTVNRLTRLRNDLARHAHAALSQNNHVSA